MIKKKKYFSYYCFINCSLSKPISETLHLVLVKEVDLKKFIAYMHLVPTNSLISFEAAFTVNVPVPCSNSLLFLEP